MPLWHGDMCIVILARYSIAIVISCISRSSAADTFHTILMDGTLKQTVIYVEVQRTM